MLTLYCNRPSLREQVTSAIPTGVPFKETVSWSAFRLQVTPLWGGLVALDCLDRDWARELVTFKHQYPLKPILLVAPCEPVELVRVVRLPLEDIVPLAAAPTRLAAAIAAMPSKSLLGEFALRIQQAPDMATRLQMALLNACQAPFPYTTLCELAASVDRSPATLWHHYRRWAPEGCALRLEDLVSWIVLIHAVARRVPGRSLRTVCAEIGVGERTLRRLAREHTGLSLGHLVTVGRKELIREFTRRVEAPLFAPLDNVAENAGSL